MYHKAQTAAYGLAIFVLLNGFFVLDDGMGERGVMGFKGEVRHEFSRAFVQTVGDKAWFEDVEIVWSGVNDFYSQSADNALALFEPREEEKDAVAVVGNIVVAFERGVNGIKGDKGMVAGETIEEEFVPQDNFMTEEPIYNIIPENDSGSVQGIYYLPFETLPAENTNSNPWVTIIDPVTGQSHCVAIFNNEISEYEGECKQDSYQ